MFKIALSVRRRRGIVESMIHSLAMQNRRTKFYAFWFVWILMTAVFFGIVCTTFAKDSARDLQTAHDLQNYRAEVKAQTLLKTSVNSLGQPIHYPQTSSPEVTALLVEIPVGGETGWHRHPVPGYGYILSGELKIEEKGHKPVLLKAGDAMIESVNILHNGKNIGRTPVKIVVFFTGIKGEPNVIKAMKK